MKNQRVGNLKMIWKKRPAWGVKSARVQRKDMVCLPRCEWRHANNSFLIHGYYNYHHLILTVRDDRLKLGVPGVYHPQEEKAAESFGFPEFVPAEELDLKLTDEEKNDREKFGYWCRDIRGSHDCVEPQEIENRKIDRRMSLQSTDEKYSERRRIKQAKKAYAMVCGAESDV